MSVELDFWSNSRITSYKSNDVYSGRFADCEGSNPLRQS